MESAERNRLRIQVGRGTPMGDPKRRHGQPIGAGVVQIDEGQAARALAHSAP